MGMGIVSPQDFEQELKRNSTNLREGLKKQVEIITPSSPGRKKGDVNVPNGLRNIIGETSIVDGREAAVELAETFGISPSSVSAYANGATSTDSYNEPGQNKPVVNKIKENIARRARNTLRNALNNITNEKLQNTSAKDLAGIAKDMSAVVKSMEPEDTNDKNDNKRPFVIFAPIISKEEKFETIYTKD
jgi:hypothetical protein